MIIIYTTIIINFLITVLVIYSMAARISGVTVNFFWTSVITAILIALANSNIGKLLQLLSLPFTIITFELFSIVITALVIYLGCDIMEDFKLKSFGWALVLSLIIVIITSLVLYFGAILFVPALNL